jgi:hypothetical protein
VGFQSRCRGDATNRVARLRPLSCTQRTSAFRGKSASALRGCPLSHQGNEEEIGAEVSGFAQTLPILRPTFSRSAASFLSLFRIRQVAFCPSSDGTRPWR